MRHFLRELRRFRERGVQYFTVFQDTVTHDNLRTLRYGAVAFELFLLSYGLWAGRAFNSPMLNRFYGVYLCLNLALLLYVYWGGRAGLHTCRLVQAGCICLIGEIMGFTIGISVFPFPDRPAIFYSLAYTLSLMLFRLRVWQSVTLFTGISAVFMALCWRYKEPAALSYDVAAAVTSWLLGFVVLFMVTDLYLRNGEARMELDRQSRTDFVTDLPNRWELGVLAERTYRRCASMRLPIAAAMVDIDRFKQFNDTYGHPAGDRCLAAVGQALKKFAEETGSFTARYGGEEFVVLLPAFGEEEVSIRAQELLERLRIRTDVGETISVSIGVAVEFPSSDGTPGALFQRADDALYEAKANGRARFVLHRPDAAAAKA